MSMRWEEPETLPRIPVYRAVGSLRSPSHHRPVPAGGAGLAEMEGASSDGRRKEEEEEEIR